MGIVLTVWDGFSGWAAAQPPFMQVALGIWVSIAGILGLAVALLLCVAYAHKAAGEAAALGITATRALAYAGIAALVVAGLLVFLWFH